MRHWFRYWSTAIVGMIAVTSAPVAAIPAITQSTTGLSNPTEIIQFCCPFVGGGGIVTNQFATELPVGICLPVGDGRPHMRHDLAHFDPNFSPSVIDFNLIAGPQCVCIDFTRTVCSASFAFSSSALCTTFKMFCGTTLVDSATFHTTNSDACILAGKDIFTFQDGFNRIQFNDTSFALVNPISIDAGGAPEADTTSAMAPAFLVLGGMLVLADRRRYLPRR